jgi:hypothetical protein
MDDIDGGIGAKQRPLHTGPLPMPEMRDGRTESSSINGVGGLRTYLSSTRTGGQPSIDRVFEAVSGMKSFPFLAGE